MVYEHANVLNSLGKVLHQTEKPFKRACEVGEEDTSESLAENFELLQECRVLVVGAGGLGNHILKALAMSNVKTIHLIDMDTLELSNLNRQILFRDADVGKAKAEVAAERINKMFGSRGVKVVPYVQKLQTFPVEFFRQFSCVIAGLDNIEARRWLNHALCQCVQFEADEYGEMIASPSSIIPLLDGGTEGFMGHARLIIPTSTSCFECSLDMFPPQRSIPLCTVVDRPRQPEHCIEYALLVTWPRERPGESPDFDNPADIDWLYAHAVSRAEQYHIGGVTRDLAVGVFKRIVPAIASTNQMIGSLLVHEAIKLLTGLYPMTQTYIMYNGAHGINYTALCIAKKPDCPVCSHDQLVGKSITICADETLEHFLSKTLPLHVPVQQPTLTVDGHTLYASLPESLHFAHEYKLTKSWAELVDEGFLNEEMVMMVSGRGLEVARRLKLILL